MCGGPGAVSGRVPDPVGYRADMTGLPARAGRRCHHSVNPLHFTTYLAPEFTAELTASGAADWHAAYFAARSAPLGAPGAATVAAVFTTYKPSVIARYVPAVWAALPPRAALDARLRAADAVLRRLLGEEALASKEMAEAAGLAVRAAEACAYSGRPLSAGFAALPVPEEPHLALWHAAGVLREYRGDGHVAALVCAGLDGLEAQVTETAGGRGMSPSWVYRTRGWTPQEWAAAQDRLRERGLLDAAGALTDEGVALRRALEEQTDRSDRAPYEHLGAAAVERLTELGTAFTSAALAAGAVPADLLGKD